MALPYKALQSLAFTLHGHGIVLRGLCRYLDLPYGGKALPCKALRSPYGAWHFLAGLCRDLASSLRGQGIAFQGLAFILQGHSIALRGLCSILLTRARHFLTRQHSSYRGMALPYGAFVASSYAGKAFPYKALAFTLQGHGIALRGLCSILLTRARHFLTRPLHSPYRGMALPYEAFVASSLHGQGISLQGLAFSLQGHGIALRGLCSILLTRARHFLTRPCIQLTGAWHCLTGPLYHPPYAGKAFPYKALPAPPDSPYRGMALPYGAFVASSLRGQGISLQGLAFTLQGHGIALRGLCSILLTWARHFLTRPCIHITGAWHCLTGPL